jgi:hypothetical protein
MHMKISYKGLIFFCFCIFSVQTLWAGNWEIPSESVQEVLISGTAAFVIVNSVAADQALKINVSGLLENRWTAVLENSKMKVQSAADFIVQGQESQIQIQVPAGKKIVIALSDGRLNLMPQVGNAFVRMIKGQITAQKTTQNLQIFLQKGELVVEGHQGDLSIETYSAKVTVKNPLGVVDVNNFMGELLVEKPISRVNLQSRFGNGRVLAPKAGVNFIWGKGQLTVTDLATRCEGNLEEGSVTLSALADSEIEVHAQKGKVQINLPSGSGAFLNLKTAGGELTVPNPLKAVKDAKYTMVKARLSGANKGSVVVQAEETSVIVR